jgi:phosphoglycolate phosphatase
VSRPAIVFDLDGTLVDSLGDIVASFRWAFGEFGLEAPSEAVVRPRSDCRWRRCTRASPRRRRRCLGRGVPASLPAAPRGALARVPGRAGGARELRARGYALAVATTKRSDMADRLVRRWA